MTTQQENLIETFSARTEKVTKRVMVFLTVEMAKEFSECEHNNLGPRDAEDLYLTVLNAVRLWVILNFPEEK